ncbi:MAG: trimethylamine methyltransferase family protein, partial [Promethearchaeota archaeon]
MLSKILTNQQIIQIHQASLEILERIGVRIPHDEILSRFKNYGASVEIKEQKVQIPSELATELIAKAGKKFDLYGRDLTVKAEFGAGKRNYNTTAGQAFWIDNIGD